MDQETDFNGYLRREGDSELLLLEMFKLCQWLCQVGIVLWLEIGLSLQGETRVPAAASEADH